MKVKESSGPQVKRLKLENNDFSVIQAILPNDYGQEIPLAAVYVSKIADKQGLSKIIKELSHHLALPPALQHLKRVHQNEIIVCPEDDVADESVREYLTRQRLSSDVVTALSENVRKVSIPAHAPKLRYQYDASQRIWPCKFHPDKYLESLYSGTNFNDGQKSFHLKICHLLLDLSHQVVQEKPCGICIDPRTQSIVAIASSKTTLGPVMHSPMVLVDYVARSQNAGAWNSFGTDEFVEDPVSDKGGPVSLAGIPKIFYEFVQKHADYKDLKFGAERLKTKGRLSESELARLADGVAEDNLSKYGPYLCTGYEVYLSYEPCLMCAMALVHSRVKRIFFVRPSQNGSLMGELKLQGIRELNHHYEVFRFARTRTFNN